MWTKARLTTCIGAALAGLALLAATMGAGTCDAATGQSDLHPFRVYRVAGNIAGPVAAVLAAVAVALGRGRK